MGGQGMVTWLGKSAKISGPLILKDDKSTKISGPLILQEGKTTKISVPLNFTGR
jgi:hypothetical protein